jgi:cell division protein FtsN
VKDYKPRPREKKRKPVGGTLLGIFIGLVLGLAIATAAAIYVTNAPVPFVNKTQQQRATTPQADQKLAEAAKAGAAEKPKFDFYKILPGSEEPVTEREIRERTRTARSQQDGAKDVYFIQAGSFQNPADADNQKARLAILGFESSVEPANLPDKGTWYRVRLGPYTRVEEINRIRQALAQNGIDASLVKIKEPQ